MVGDRQVDLIELGTASISLQKAIQRHGIELDELLAFTDFLEYLADSDAS